MKTGFCVIAAILLGALGCTGGEGGSDDEVCAALVGKVFRAVTERECGEGDGDGVAMCRWRLDFEETSQGALHATWYHSDVVDGGIVTCDEGALTVRSGGGPTYTGTYDPDTETVIWEDLEYQLVEP
jgi:hypothetical protein